MRLTTAQRRGVDAVSSGFPTNTHAVLPGTVNVPAAKLADRTTASAEACCTSSPSGAKPPRSPGLFWSCRRSGTVVGQQMGTHGVAQSYLVGDDRRKGKAGVVGSFPALNARPRELLAEWIVRIKSELEAHRAAHPGARVAPFAVNQIAHKSNDRLEHDVDVCVRHEVPIIITSLRAPADVVKAVHAYGGIVLHDVTLRRAL